MRARIALSIIAFLILSAAGRQRTFMGMPVTEMEFTIAGGTKVSLPVTDAGPLPAETRDFKVEVAGATVRPALFAPKQPALASVFALTVKKGKAPKRVVVEEVFPTEVAAVLVDDSKPVLRGTTWNGSSARADPTPASAPWVFTEGTTIFVVRFTITPEKGKPVVLYQPVWYSAQSKRGFRQIIETIRGNG